MGDVLNFTVKLIDDENKDIKFEDKEKKVPIVNLANFQLTVQKKDKTIQEDIRFLKLT